MVTQRKIFFPESSSAGMPERKEEKIFSIKIHLDLYQNQRALFCPFPYNKGMQLILYVKERMNQMVSGELAGKINVCPE